MISKRCQSFLWAAALRLQSATSRRKTACAAFFCCLATQPTPRGSRTSCGKCRAVTATHEPPGLYVPPQHENPGPAKSPGNLAARTQRAEKRLCRESSAPAGAQFEKHIPGRGTTKPGAVYSGKARSNSKGYARFPRELARYRIGPGCVHIRCGIATATFSL